MRVIAAAKSKINRVMSQVPKPVQSSCDTAKFGEGSPELFKAVPMTQNKTMKLSQKNGLVPSLKIP